VAERREDSRAEEGERAEGRSAWCALILVDLDVPADASADDLRASLERLAQQTRFAAFGAGVLAGDARGVVVESPMADVVRALVQVTQ
jgi:hypothetical protein